LNGRGYDSVVHACGTSCVLAIPKRHGISMTIVYALRLLVTRAVCTAVVPKLFARYIFRELDQGVPQSKSRKLLTVFPHLALKWHIHLVPKLRMLELHFPYPICLYDVTARPRNNRLLQLQCTNPSTINHALTSLRQFYVIWRWQRGSSYVLCTYALPDDGSV